MVLSENRTLVMKLSVPHVATYCCVPSHVMKLSVPHLATYCYVPSHVLPPANDLLIVVRPYIFVHLGCICIEYIWKYGPHLISSFGSSHPWVHMRSFSLVPWSSTYAFPFLLAVSTSGFLVLFLCLFNSILEIRLDRQLAQLSLLSNRKL